MTQPCEKRPAGLGCLGFGPRTWTAFGRRRTVAAPDDPREAERVARALDGDREAFGELVQAYSARIYTHILRLVRDREEAEDLAQEAFVRAYRGLSQYDPSRPFRNWLYAVATNVGLNGLRSRRRRLPSASRWTAEELGSTDAPDPRTDVRQRIAQAELQERMNAMIDRLPPRSAALLHLHYREGVSLAEAGEILGMTETAAKVALHRARRNLREWLLEDELNEL